MNKCNVCNREFTTKSALVNHSQKCVEAKEELEVGKDIPEAKEELVEPSYIPDLAIRLNKLRDSYYSTYDGEGRYRIEQEYISLNGSAEGLRK